jgi:hypothetical protein
MLLEERIETKSGLSYKHRFALISIRMTIKLSSYSISGCAIFLYGIVSFVLKNHCTINLAFR